eukprot:TRINITY_DN49409_c0_g1_i1.p1 TRINITY_DN49409_c0_g1~~TRINITY_DN49409_c0_g1_i1.p1  ORF type:complete len:416 (+),score=56.52 TRINITY_DN49409_c0_g1_i1:204-1451(+)
MLRHRIVLVGDVGVGKSSVVERVCGVTGISSALSGTCTMYCRSYVTMCGRLLIVDTPGCNASAEKIWANHSIAHALTSQPVSLILIVAKADTRIDNTIFSLRSYAECFQDFVDILGFCVTHMDTVTWAPEMFLRRMEAELGINTCVFFPVQAPQDVAIDVIARECKEPRKLTIKSDNFLKFFRMNDDNLKISKFVREEVSSFQAQKGFVSEFLRDIVDLRNRLDLLFEFHAFLSLQISLARKRVARANNFSFSGLGRESELGHIANLTNQLRGEMSEVRSLAQVFARQHGESGWRRCPFCGFIWERMETCVGHGTCGNGRPCDWNGGFAILGTFIFHWDGSRLQIDKAGSRYFRGDDAAWYERSFGCGNAIVWMEMAPVSSPAALGGAMSASSDAPPQAAPRGASRGCHFFAMPS